jgi:uncharacterized C2H2 Zn-finger protein
MKKFKFEGLQKIWCVLCPTAVLNNYAASGGDPRQCPFCGLIMAPSTSLKRHIVSLHSRGENHGAICPFCQKTFKNKYTMWSHRSKFHYNQNQTQK